jgi:hypothetical protein
MIVRRTLAALAIGAVLAGATATAASAGVPEGMTKGEYRALHIRSEGLTSYGQTLQASTPVASTSASTSFAWDAFGIGIAAAFGLVLLTGGLAGAVRTGTRKRVSIPS